MAGTATLARRLAVFGLGLFGIGTAAAVFAPNLPVAAVMGSMLVGAVTTVLAGTVLLWRERQRNQLTGIAGCDSGGAGWATGP
ncbi:MAG: hypothetical protein HYT81_00575 [Gemmatimonadetes bacterium]|nr:hypothetical protein [Gemmatimonadota bacterium]